MIKPSVLVLFYLLGVAPLFGAHLAEEGDVCSLENVPARTPLSTHQQCLKLCLDFKRITNPIIDVDRIFPYVTHVHTLVLSGAYDNTSLMALEKIVQEKNVTVLVLSGTRQAAEYSYFLHLSANFGNIEGIRRYKQKNPIAGQEAVALLRTIVNCIPLLKAPVGGTKKQGWPLVIMGNDFEKDRRLHATCFQQYHRPCPDSVCYWMRQMNAKARASGVTIKWDDTV